MPEAARAWGHKLPYGTLDISLTADASRVAVFANFHFGMYAREGEELWKTSIRPGGCVAMPSDGAFAVVAASTGGEALTLFEPWGAVRWRKTSQNSAWPAVAVSRAGETLVEVRQRTVTAYDIRGVELFSVNPWPAPADDTSAIAPDPGFTLFGVRGPRREWVLLDLRGNERLRIGTLPWNCHPLFLPDGLLMHPDVSMSTDIIGRTFQGAEQWRITTPAEIKDYGATPDGTKVVVAGLDNKIRTYGSDQEIVSTVSARSEVTCLAVDRRGRYWAAGTISGALLFSDMEGKVFFKEADKAAWMRRPIVFAEQGDLVVAGSSKGLVAAYYVHA